MMLNRLAATLVVFAATLSGGCATPPAPNSAQSPRTIPVVKTWGDLLKQEPIDLGDGVKVLLGIEATECPRGSGVLLYCLTEGYNPSKTKEDFWQLGPLKIFIPNHELACFKPSGISIL